MCTTCSPPLPWAITVCGIFRLSAAFSSSSSRSPINSSPHAPLQSHFGVKLHCGGLPNKTSAWLISIGPRLCPMQSLKKSGCRWRTGFIRPFEIVHIINLSAIHLKLPAAMKIHPSFNVSRLRPFLPAYCDSYQVSSPSWWTIVQFLSIHKILDVWQRGGGLQFLVDWEGYGLEERCWIPQSFIMDPSLL